MSGKGNCYDNAVVESFFATLKTEEVKGADYQTRQQAKTAIFSYVEGFYIKLHRLCLRLRYYVLAVTTRIECAVVETSSITVIITHSRA